MSVSRYFLDLLHRRETSTKSLQHDTILIYADIEEHFRVVVWSVYFNISHCPVGIKPGLSNSTPTNSLSPL